jgi:hypothetical protein
MYEDDYRHGPGVWTCKGKSYDYVYERGTLASECERLADIGEERRTLLQRWGTINGMSRLLEGVQPEDIDVNLLRALKKLTDVALAQTTSK